MELAEVNSWIGMSLICSASSVSPVTETFMNWVQFENQLCGTLTLTVQIPEGEEMSQVLNTCIPEELERVTLTPSLTRVLNDPPLAWMPTFTKGLSGHTSRLAMVLVTVSHVLDSWENCTEVLLNGPSDATMWPEFSSSRVLMNDPIEILYLNPESSTDATPLSNTNPSPPTTSTCIGA